LFYPHDTLLQQNIHKNMFKFKFNVRLKTCANLIPMKLNICSFGVKQRSLT
jgi:hypothetical protein